MCTDIADKGRGAFATADLEEGTFLGVYWGERLTRRQYDVRHSPSDEPPSPPPNEEEAMAHRARTARIAALPEFGRPMGGTTNEGSYVFGLVPSAFGMDATQHRETIAYIDAEDPNLGSWNRYLNHCDGDEYGCNVEVHHDCSRALLWMVTTRCVRAGEELCYSYVQDRTNGLVNLLASTQGGLSGPTMRGRH